jgi:hypothetical protein
MTLALSLVAVKHLLDFPQRFLMTLLIRTQRCWIQMLRQLLQEAQTVALMMILLQG